MGRQGAHQFQLVLRQAEALAIVPRLGPRIGHEDLGRRLDALRQSLGDNVWAWWPPLIGTPYPGPLAPELDEPPIEPRLRVAL